MSNGNTALMFSIVYRHSVYFVRLDVEGERRICRLAVGR
jgi:hypothetical protein